MRHHPKFQQEADCTAGCRTESLAPRQWASALIAVFLLLATPAVAQDVENSTRVTVGDERVAPVALTEPNVVALEEYNDPLEPVNRVIFRFNDFATRYAVAPLGKGYMRLVPLPARKGIGNFFDNVKTPIRAVNHLLQGRPQKMGKSLARFGINTTLGIGGVFDPAAKRFDLPIQPTNFESTLARYGAGYGFYLELPFFGPSDLRNGTGRVADYFLNPIPQFVDTPESTIIQAFDFLQDFAPFADDYETLRQKAEDPYIFFRNLYLQGAERDAVYEGTQ